MNQIQHLSWYNFKAGESISDQRWYISVGTQCQRQLDVYDCPTTTTDSATVPLFVRFVPPPPWTWLVYCLGEVSGPQFYTSQSKIWIKWQMLPFHSYDRWHQLLTRLARSTLSWLGRPCPCLLVDCYGYDDRWKVWGVSVGLRRWKWNFPKCHFFSAFCWLLLFLLHPR